MTIEHNELPGDTICQSSDAQRKCRVLIADDYPDDRFFLKRAMAMHAPLMEVVAEVEDGEEVIAYLSGDGPYADRLKFPLPDLLIMDVRMPRMTGIAVMDWLATQNFPAMRVAILADDGDKPIEVQGLRSQPSHYFSKNDDLEELMVMVKQLQTEMEGDSRQSAYAHN